MILVLEDRYEAPLSIDTKNIPVALHLMSQWYFNDVRVTKTRFLQFFTKNRLIFQILPKIPGKCDFDRVFC